jgi:hypothetical protein
MSTIYIKLFKNENKVEGDNKPVYQNNKVQVKQKIVLDPDRIYSSALWKNKDDNGNDDGTLNLKLELKDEEFNQSPDI